MKTLKIMLSSMLLVVFFASVSYSQTDKQVNEVVSTLKQKVLLSDDQEKSVLNILTELKNNISTNPKNKDSLIKEAQSKLESLLDKKQKMKYEILKNDLWKKF